MGGFVVNTCWGVLQCKKLKFPRPTFGGPLSIKAKSLVFSYKFAILLKDQNTYVTQSHSEMYPAIILLQVTYQGAQSQQNGNLCKCNGSFCSNQLEQIKWSTSEVFCSNSQENVGCFWQLP